MGDNTRGRPSRFFSFWNPHAFSCSRWNRILSIRNGRCHSRIPSRRSIHCHWCYLLRERHGHCFTATSHCGSRRSCHHWIYRHSWRRRGSIWRRGWCGWRSHHSWLLLFINDNDTIGILDIGIMVATRTTNNLRIKQFGGLFPHCKDQKQLQTNIARMKPSNHGVIPTFGGGRSKSWSASSNLFGALNSLCSSDITPSAFGSPAGINRLLEVELLQALATAAEGTRFSAPIGFKGGKSCGCKGAGNWLCWEGFEGWWTRPVEDPFNVRGIDDGDKARGLLWSGSRCVVDWGLRPTAQSGRGGNGCWEDGVGADTILILEVYERLVNTMVLDEDYFVC